VKLKILKKTEWSFPTNFCPAIKIAKVLQPALEVVAGDGTSSRENLAAIALLIVGVLLLFFPQFIMSFKFAHLLGNALFLDIIHCHDY